MDDSRLQAVRSVSGELDSVTEASPSTATDGDQEHVTGATPIGRMSARGAGVFGEVEDVVSVGALMRPTLSKAMGLLSPEERLDLKVVLLEIETHLSKASLPYAERFALIRESFTRTFRYGPIWRFISGRVEECWTTAVAPSFREFSMVSLLIGMIFEELHAANGARKNSRLA